jgi:hypothetical protein
MDFDKNDWSGVKRFLNTLVPMSIAIALLAPASLALAQEPHERLDRPAMSAIRIDNPPLLDGIVGGDPAWETIQPSSGFIQTSPDEGQPASQRTELRVAYTDDTLYVGIICFDDNPDAIIINDNRRDANLAESDSLRIIFDTYHDRQNGLVFGTNPAGLQYDGQVIREGSRGVRLQ